MRIITNTPGLSQLQDGMLEIDSQYAVAGKSRLASEWDVFKRSFNCDFIIIICNPTSVLIQGFLHKLFFFNRSKVVSVDSVMPMPIGFKQVAIARLKSLAFKGVDLFIEYFKDTRGYQKYYGIDKHKFRYTPFKINRYEKVLALIEQDKISDQGYIFCGGNTRRDFDSLIKVAKRVELPFLIVTMDNKIINQHGSHLDESTLPNNIKVVHHDGSDTFLDYIAGAKLVALPVRKRNISASGIGVYLASMALKKCVVISHGPAVDGIIKDEAILVPPEDADALEEAISKAYHDDDYRNGFAERGQAYALSLQGEERLYRSIIEIIQEDAGT
jgi:glycosyltransferase involved in cell wall biosynthesis